MVLFYEMHRRTTPVRNKIPSTKHGYALLLHISRMWDLLPGTYLGIGLSLKDEASTT